MDVLAERAASWLVDPLDTVVPPSTNTSNGQLIVYLDIADPQRNRGSDGWRPTQVRGLCPDQQGRDGSQSCQ
ncbi:hypothetical protein AB0892_07395 [Streptomyces sp. NPDC005409]|uniref:hypothetical protein n=1 Tax=Streptomyces sp. NPDC005409 TaxID=3155342 RepID=UPI0034543C6E